MNYKHLAVSALIVVVVLAVVYRVASLRTLVIGA
jgi:hypothetical protein